MFLLNGVFHGDKSHVVEFLKSYHAAKTTTLFQVIRSAHEISTDFSCKDWLENSTWLKPVVYLYNKDTLLELTNSPPWK